MSRPPNCATGSAVSALTRSSPSAPTPKKLVQPDCFAEAVAPSYTQDMSADAKIQDRRDELFDMELEKFVAGVMGKEHVENKQLTWF